MSIAVLNFKGKTVTFIIQKVRKIVTDMTADVLDYPTPNPPLANATTQVDTLETAFQDAVDGGKSLKAQVRIEKKNMLFIMSLLRAYVQNASGADKTKIYNSGFDVKSPGSPIGLLPPPVNVRSEYGLHPGEIIVRWNGVPKRREYRVQISNDPPSANSWTDLPNGDTGKVRLVVSGLTSGQLYWFRVFTLSAEGYSGPSDATGHRAV